MEKRNLALFDFDGTISDRDSFLLFVRKTVGTGRFCAGMARLAPQIGRFLLKCYPNQNLKEDVLTCFFQGYPLTSFTNAAEKFCRETVPLILRREAEARLCWHLEQGDRVAVVSATPELILAPWCRERGLDLLATRLQVADGILSGRIEGENFRGMVKVAQIKNKYRLGDYKEIYAYGDTSGDKPMLAMATHSFYRPFRGQ